MTDVLDPAPLPGRARPSRLIRWALALSTSPVPADFTNSEPLNAYLAMLRDVGWMIRQAYYRNWTIWRDGDDHPNGLIVLPIERPSSTDDFALFVAAEVLRSTTRARPVDNRLIRRLVPSLGKLPDAAIDDRLRRVELQLTGFRFWR